MTKTRYRRRSSVYMENLYNTIHKRNVKQRNRAKNRVAGKSRRKNRKR